VPCDTFKGELTVNMIMKRRRALGTLSGLLAVFESALGASAQGASPLASSRLPDEQVHTFVQLAHSDRDATRRMLDAEPRLIRATWDWGGGDFETALGGAAHMGRRDIAALLLERGAPLDLFAAAMLGELAIVRAALERRPQLARVPGPHGIPLVAHAKAGGPEARAVLDYVGSVLARLERKD
jgi:hypothetical protein